MTNGPMLVSDFFHLPNSIAHNSFSQVSTKLILGNTNSTFLSGFYFHISEATAGIMPSNMFLGMI
jgi:hypothetical protein